MGKAYENWLIEIANKFPDPKKQLSQILIRECLMKNHMAFDIMARVQPDNWTNETFEKAAEMLLTDKT